MKPSAASGRAEIYRPTFRPEILRKIVNRYIKPGGNILPGLRGGSKLKTLFFGGEGLVCQFSGQGRVWIQTRHVHSFLSWVNPYRPAKRN